MALYSLKRIARLLPDVKLLVPVVRTLDPNRLHPRLPASAWRLLVCRVNGDLDFLAAADLSAGAAWWVERRTDLGQRRVRSKSADCRDSSSRRKRSVSVDLGPWQIRSPGTGVQLPGQVV